jgi:hypothetical protein
MKQEKNRKSMPLVGGRMLPVTVILMMLAPAAVRAQAWPVPCERAANAAQREAISAARAAFEAKWLKTDKYWATAFQVTPPPAPTRPNPFATKAEPTPEVPQVTVTGVIRADGLQCQVTESSEIVVEIYGTGIRFFEPGPGWSAPLPRGLLSAVAVTTKDGKPLVVEKTEYATVILPGATLHLPAIAEVPPLAAVSPKKSGNR